MTIKFDPEKLSVRLELSIPDRDVLATHVLHMSFSDDGDLEQEYIEKDESGRQRVIRHRQKGGGTHIYIGLYDLEQQTNPDSTTEMKVAEGTKVFFPPGDFFDAVDKLRQVWNNGRDARPNEFD